VKACKGKTSVGFPALSVAEQAEDMQMCVAAFGPQNIARHDSVFGEELNLMVLSINN
jgi:hypothetical protein